MPPTDPLGEPDNGTPLTDEERRGLRLPILTRDIHDDDPAGTGYPQWYSPCAPVAEPP